MPGIELKTSYFLFVDLLHNHYHMRNKILGSILQANNS